jgi:hypothetical protein
MTEFLDKLARDFQPHQAFEIELNVPLALSNNPNVVIPDNAPPMVDFDGYILGVATYRTPYPGQNPKRFQAFVLTPAVNLTPNYPILSGNDVTLNRSDDERYFMSMAKMIECYLNTTRLSAPVYEIADKYEGRTAQEMIDYFKPYESQQLSITPTFTPVSK